MIPIVAALLLSGCGSDSDGESADTDVSSPSATSDSTTAPEAEADVDVEEATTWAAVGEAVCNAASPEFLAETMQSVYGLTGITAEPAEEWITTSEEAASAVCHVLVSANGTPIDDLYSTEAAQVAGRGDCGSLGDVFLSVSDIHVRTDPATGDVVVSADEFSYGVPVKATIPASTAIEVLDGIEAYESSQGEGVTARPSSTQLVVGPDYREALGEDHYMELSAYTYSSGTACASDFPFFEAVAEVVRPVLEESLPPPVA